ncbi:hypothetical protein Hbl1158_04665 [Halobaculum sp. CBA1158]|uniref:hypothetical protein n=1 Tax=Halobaculum sp. CBA1158 TaxID=2904243 RepID=UPI001F38DD96|nr:hypothetical protein [Halobaculum sp. CBA1158]UIP00656.1 hypothetical protein Hbl1158_04665 [Halobaculum sp. CBA1158]
MGEAASRVQRRLRERLASAVSGRTWHTEYPIGSTPVDVAGVGDDIAAVELEWRRADPADNTVTLFRELAASDLDSTYGSVTVVQVFSRYYDLRSGGHSTKRRNAEFVGERIARTVPGASFAAVTLDVDPPKRGGDLPADWRDAVDDVADRVADAVGEE